jgi:threonine/homoserine/homoserine lactone efflux protein
VITLDQVLTFGLAALIIIAIPGPSVVFVVGRALTYGRTVALASVAGNSLGLLTVIVLVALGLGVVVQDSHPLFLALKYAGAAYLLWLGIDGVRRRREFLDQGTADRRASRMTWQRAIRQGYLVGVSNPKGYLMMAAVLPQFIDRSAGQVQLQMLLLGLIAFVIGIASDSLWAVVASRLRIWFAGSARRGELVGATGGLSMIGLGVAIAVTGEH